MVLLLMLLLLSSAHRASPNRTDLTATPLQHNYLSLPMYLDSDLPLVRRDFFSPASGAGPGPGPGPEALPRPVRELLLPAGPPARGPPGAAAAAAVRVSCERNKMRLQVDRSVLGSGEPGAHLQLGTCTVSASTGEQLHFEYDLRMCGTKRTVSLEHNSWSWSPHPAMMDCR